MGAGQPLHGAGDLQSAAYPCPQSSPGRRRLLPRLLDRGRPPLPASASRIHRGLLGTTSLPQTCSWPCLGSRWDSPTPTSPSSTPRALPLSSDRDGTNSEAFIIIDFGQRIVLIGGTSYAGEIKKSAFTVMNYLLPNEGVLPMHCSANAGPDGDVALFFGLSGTGKTTLSATSDRTLIGDDEHGWTADSVFNFEGGCYAKVIRLSEEAEPEIYATTRQFGTILENVTIDLDTRALDLDDDSITENTRGSYPLSSIPNADPTGVAEMPKNIFFLTADAFGIIPPISRLTPEQTEYHFLSGYTAKVAGTERGDSRARSHIQPMFRRTFHAHAAPGLRRNACPQARRLRRERLAG